MRVYKGAPHGGTQLTKKGDINAGDVAAVGDVDAVTDTGDEGDVGDVGGVDSEAGFEFAGSTSGKDSEVGRELACSRSGRNSEAWLELAGSRSGVTHVHRRMRGINIGGADRAQSLKHFGEELIIICQRESGLKYWGGLCPLQKNIGGAPAPPAPPFLRL